MSLLATRPFTQGFDLDWAPDVDCYDVENGMRIRVDLPGCRKEDVTAEFNEGNLLISGERKYTSQGMKYLNERLYGK